MPVKADAKHVKDFTLEPVGGCPDRNRTGNAFAVGDHNFHANTFVPRERIQNPDYVELFFALWIVDCGDVYAVIELLPVPKNLQQLENNGGFYDQIVLAQVAARFANARAGLALELSSHGGF